MFFFSILYKGVLKEMEKYSRGRRGAPAKGVGRETAARVRIPLSPPVKLLLIEGSTFFIFILVFMTKNYF